MSVRLNPSNLSDAQYDNWVRKTGREMIVPGFTGKKAAPKVDPQYAALQQSEMYGVQSQFANARRGVQAGQHARGMSGSGFGGGTMSRLSGDEAYGVGQVQAGLTDRLMDYKFQQQQLAAMRSAAKKARKKSKKRGKLGAALGIAGIVLAPFTGGASLALTAAGGGMMAS